MLQSMGSLLEKQQGIEGGPLYMLHLCQSHQALHILWMLLPNSTPLDLHDESSAHEDQEKKYDG